jgi:DNA-binding transcriptional ArsR family regulator
MNTVTLSALAEPTRLRIIELLRDGPLPVGEISEQLSIRQPQVSKHLRVLSEAGLVQAEPVAQQRIYHLQAEPFEELDNWVATFRRLWNTRLDAFEEYMEELKKTEQD